MVCQLTDFQSISPTCWICRMRRKEGSIMLPIVKRVQPVWSSCIRELQLPPFATPNHGSASCQRMYAKCHGAQNV